MGPPAPEGVALEGVALEGVALEGVALEGVALKGVALEGVALEGVALEGVGSKTHLKYGWYAVLRAKGVRVRVYLYRRIFDDHSTCSAFVRTAPYVSISCKSATGYSGTVKPMLAIISHDPHWFQEG